MKSHSLTVRSSLAQSSFWLLIPIVLSAFTHLWNPIGFPYAHNDEGHYMRRTMQVLHGLGPQETISVYYSPYDHPYFGQLFLASVLGIIGYPSSLHPTANTTTDSIHSIEMLYTVPRVLMGLLAVLDTFLIYKIAEVRYNRKVAFIASILFAVMPLSWLTRRILLDSIQLPFLLLSILFAVYCAKKNYCSSSLSLTSSSSTTRRTTRLYNEEDNNNINKNKKKNTLLILLSGIFLGLAIFTKIPAFTMIPLVGFLVISTNKNKNNDLDDNSTIKRGIVRRNIITNLRNLNLKALGLWFIPVILIPLIWPAYAISIGHFDDWFNGITWQAQRQQGNNPLLRIINTYFQIDPVLLILTSAGLVFTTVIKKDFWPMLWIVPFLIFLNFIGHISHFYLIPLIPLFCIAAAILVDTSNRLINTKKNIQQLLLPVAIISAIAIFGLINTTMLITTNLNSSYYKVSALINEELPDNKKDAFIYNNNNNKKVTVIGDPRYFWIPKYVFYKDQHDYEPHYKKSSVKSEKILLVVDKGFIDVMSKKDKKAKAFKTIYENTNNIATFEANTNRYDLNKYPYTSMKLNSEKQIEIRRNY